MNDILKAGSGNTHAGILSHSHERMSSRPLKSSHHAIHKCFIEQDLHRRLAAPPRLLPAQSLRKPRDHCPRTSVCLRRSTLPMFNQGSATQRAHGLADQVTAVSFHHPISRALGKALESSQKAPRKYSNLTASFSSPPLPPFIVRAV